MKGFQKGNIPWNKGLTKETNKTVALIALKKVGVKRPNQSKRMKGKNNPFFGKKHSIETKKKMNKNHWTKNHWTKNGKWSKEEIKEKIGKHKKGKTYEELYGKEKSDILKQNQSNRKKGKKGCTHTIKTKNYLHDLAIKNKLGGHFSKRNTYLKNIRNEQFCLNSSYEVIFAKSMNLNNIYWIRPEPLKWTDKNNIEHLYYPDFYIPTTNIYYDTKNDYLIKIDKDKIQRVIKQNKIKLLILDKNHLEYKTP